MIKNLVDLLLIPIKFPNVKNIFILYIIYNVKNFYIVKIKRHFK